jgi:hypothetical protein
MSSFADGGLRGRKPTSACRRCRGGSPLYHSHRTVNSADFSAADAALGTDEIGVWGLIPTRVDIGVPKEARKHFFFEKKKQKTLVLLPDAPNPSLTELE